MINLVGAFLMYALGLPFAQEAAVPVDQEPAHKIVFKNEYIVVMRALLPPGEKTLAHTHSRSRAAVNLSEATVKEEAPDKESMQTLVINAGSILVQDGDKQPYTHRLTNLGTTVYDVIDIELLKRPEGSPTDPIAIPAAENAAFRVYKWELAPGTSTPQHAHFRPYLIIAASKMQLAMTAPGGETMEHPIMPGDLHWIESNVTHTLTNRGREAGTIVEVELR